MDYGCTIRTLIKNDSRPVQGTKVHIFCFYYTFLFTQPYIFIWLMTGSPLGQGMSRWGLSCPMSGSSISLQPLRGHRSMFVVIFAFYLRFPSTFVSNFNRMEHRYTEFSRVYRCPCVYIFSAMSQRIKNDKCSPLICRYDLLEEEKSPSRVYPHCLLALSTL